MANSRDSHARPHASEKPRPVARPPKDAWNGSTLTLQSNLVRLRAYQEDAGQPLRGNHNGGVIAFGPDHKLYVYIGDNGRRGQTQNLLDGPFGPNIPDDQFGGPEPDDAHLTGVILRLDEDGTAPSTNPFFSVGAAIGGQVGANIQKVFSYGHRNSFGLTFDPQSGKLWIQENGDDSFSELNLVEAGMNGGWVQLMGPLDRVAQFKAIETSTQYSGLQQIRWSPTNIADTPAAALARLFMLPGAHYRDPVFSWRFEVSPGGIGFVNGRALGAQFQGDLFVGGARDLLAGGHLFRFKLTHDRRNVDVDDLRLQDRVADNLDKWEITESESLLIGYRFGVITDVESAPNGNLFVVSLTTGSIFEIYQASEPQLVRGTVVEFPHAGSFILDCTDIPVFSRNLDLDSIDGQPSELRVVNVGTAANPRLEVVSARPVSPLFEMGALRAGVPETWEIRAPQGSLAAAWLTATSQTGYFPAGESGTWLLGEPFVLAGSGVASQQGRVRFDVTAPNVRHLLGVSFTAQAAYLTTLGRLTITNADCEQLRSN